MNLPKRLPYEIVLAGCLLIGSCDEAPKPQFNAAQHDEILDIAHEATSQDRQRIAAIEQKLNMDEGDDS